MANAGTMIEQAVYLSGDLSLADVNQALTKAGDTASMISGTL